jgi:hypothetical protein
MSESTSEEFLFRMNAAAATAEKLATTGRRIIIMAAREEGLKIETN